MHTGIVQRKQKAVRKRTAKFIDKLKPCKYSLTNRELKKQIFSNLEHTNQIERATEIPLRLIIFPAITISDITIFESLPSNGKVTVFRTIRPEFCPPFRSQTLKKALLSLSLIHISEPTRLGMISYAVFCLKKKCFTGQKTAETNLRLCTISV